MDLRPATALDLPAIAALHAANWRRDYAGLLPSVVLGGPLDDLMAALWTQQARRYHSCLVARAADRVIGFAAFDPDKAGGLYLSSLHVAAQALMGAVAAIAGTNPLWLEVLCGNHPARGVYRRWGGAESAPFIDQMLGVQVESCRVTWGSGAALAQALGAASLS
jgi:ribosomal protein S18 acetylase RimI-like enzyme